MRGEDAGKVKLVKTVVVEYSNGDRLTGTYEYDAQYRLTKSINVSDNIEVTFTYNDTGDLIKSEFSSDERLVFSRTFTKNGNIINVTGVGVGYDPYSESTIELNANG